MRRLTPEEKLELEVFVRSGGEEPFKLLKSFRWLQLLWYDHQILVDELDRLTSMPESIEVRKGNGDNAYK